MNPDSALSRRLAGTAVLLAALSVVGKAVGLLREMVVARMFGAGSELDAFYLAYTVPDLLSFAAFFVATNLFLPEYVAARERSEDEATRLARGFLARTGTLLVGLGAVLSLGAPWLVDALAPAMAPGLRETAVVSVRVLAALVVLRGLDGALRGLMHAHRRFVVPVMGTLLFSVLIIACVVAFADRLGVVAIAAGYALGAAAPVAFMVPVVRRWLRSPGPGEGPHPALARIRRRLPVFVLIEACGLGIPLIDRVLAARWLDDGAISALAFAQVVQKLPFDVVALTLAAAVFPEFAALHARGDVERFRALARRSVRGLVGVMLPAAALFVVLREPLARAVFERGAFDAADTLLTAGALAGLALGLPFHAAASVLMQGSYAAGRERRLLAARLGSLGVKLAVSLVLLAATSLGHVGLALGTSAFYVAFVLLLARPLLGSLGGLVPRPLVVLPAAAAAAGVGHLAAAWTATRGWETGVPGLAAVGGAVALALVLYLAVCRAGRVEEVVWMEERIRARLRPGPRA